MPIYEFYSPDSNKIYSFYARRLMGKDILPFCPDDPTFRMEKMISQFSFTGQAKEGGSPDAPLDFDPRQEAAMMQLAQEMEGMGDSDPDPRNLGKMMRKMLEISGQKAPGEMEEMLRRLESGEDPEKLEEEFGPAMEAFDPSGDSPEANDLSRRSPAFRRPPTRDPKLHEFSDFLPPPAS